MGKVHMMLVRKYASYPYLSLRYRIWYWIANRV